MNILGILRSVLALVLLGFMISLWKWNVDNTGTWFAIAMILLPVAMSVASILDNYKSFKK